MAVTCAGLDTPDQADNLAFSTPHNATITAGGTVTMISRNPQAEKKTSRILRIPEVYFLFHGAARQPDGIQIILPATGERTPRFFSPAGGTPVAIQPIREISATAIKGKTQDLALITL